MTGPVPEGTGSPRDARFTEGTGPSLDARFTGVPDAPGDPAAVVVVDVMRAFTVTAWAFARGAEKAVLAASLAEALALKSVNPGWLALTDGPPQPGFDLVNSPGLLRSTDLTGRTLIQKTTSGTVGVHAVRDAALLLCASFVVAGATAELLRATGTGEVTFVVTGEDGRAEEDLACAQYIAARAAGTAPEVTGFLNRAATTSHAAAGLADGVRRGLPGIHAADVALCLEADRFPFAMAAAREGPLMVLRPVTAPVSW